MGSFARLCACLSYLLLLVLATGCSSGGGSSGDDSISVTPSSLSFQAEQNGTLPASRHLDISSSNPATYQILAGFPTGTTPPDWLDMQFDSSSRVRLFVTSTNFSPGTRDTMIRVGTARIDGTLIDYKDVPITYTITEPQQLSLNATSLSFTADEGVAPVNQDISLSVNTGSMPSWSASVSYSGAESGWLSVTPDRTNNSITVGVTPLVTGTYQATIIVSYTTAAGSNTVSVPVTYSATSVADISPSSLSFSAFLGEQPPAQNVSVTIDAADPSWTASVQYDTGSNWLSLTTTADTLTVQPSALSGGSYSATVDIRYSVGGANQSVVSIPVNYEVNGAVSLDQPTFTISAVEGEDPPAQNIDVGYLGSDSVTSWTATINYSGGASGWLNVTPNTGTTLPVTLSVDAGIATVGTYEANIALNYTINGFQGDFTIPVMYTVSAGVSLSQTDLSFSTREGKQASAQGNDIEYTGSGTLPWSILISPASASAWLSVTPDSGAALPAAISVQPVIQQKGIYDASVFVNYSVDGVTQTRQFSVHYTVEDAWAPPMPAELSFTLTNDTTLADLSQTVTIGDLFDDGSALSWTASSDVDWLTVTPDAGDTDTNGTITVSLDETNLIAIANNDSATVTLIPDDPNVSSLTIPVVVSKNVTSISGVTPKVRYTNRPTEVIIRGTGFNMIPAGTISFGGQNASSIDIISDTEVHVTPPADVMATPGTYHVNLGGASALDFSTADLVVVDPPVYPVTAITLSGRPSTVIHDPLRNAVFYTTINGIYKLQHDTGTTWNASNTLYSTASGLNLLPDGSELLVTAASAYDNKLLHVDPDTLVVGNEEPISVYYEFYRVVAPLNNGVSVLVDTDQWTTIKTYPGMENLSSASLRAAQVIMSEDRDRVILASSNYSYATRLYDASDDSYTQVINPGPNVSSRTRMGTSERGERTVILLDVYDANFSNLGSLDTTTQGPLAVSPDGSRVYMANGNLISEYDISGNVGPFAQVGTATAFTSDTNFTPVGVLISQDGSTLFIYGATFTGDYILFIYPIP